jgi:hypothetical protein
VSDEPSREEAADAAKEAVDAERLLPMEEPDSRRLEDAHHWRAVYRELVDSKSGILDLTRERIHATAKPPVRDELGLDQTVMEAELERLRRRLRFWECRIVELGGDGG